jgi:DNA-binding MarR family transcriptional regulator
MPGSTVVDDVDLTAFVEAFDEFVRAAKRARSRAVVGEDALSPSQYDLLFPLLDAGGPLGLRELARAAGVSAPTATRMIDGLAARGLVSRERCADDRRAVRLSLTGAGETAVRTQQEAQLARRRELYERLAPDDRRAAARVLSRLAAAYEEVQR